MSNQVEEEKIETKTIDIARVTRVTAGGKHLRFRVALVAGDRKGKVGFGLGKGRDIPEATERALYQAIKNLIEVPILNKTIPFETSAKYCSAEVLLKPQKKGKGIIAGGPIRVIAELGGIPNLTAKILSRSGNKTNIARAALKALSELKKRTFFWQKIKKKK